MSAPLVFSTAAYEDMAGLVCGLGCEAGAVTRWAFPDGERYLRIDSEVFERDAVVIGGTISDADTLELYDLASTLVFDGARRLILVIPFYGYSTMERRTEPGEVVGAKTRARLLSSIPAAAMGNQVMLFDLHVDSVAHYFEGAIRPVHIHARELVMQAIRDLGGDSFVLGCTDAGRAKWVESLAHDLGVPVGFVYKRRTADGGTEVTGVSAHVSGARVVIYDDMIRTGSSLIGAAQAYRDHGATGVAAVSTHGLFPGNALEQILDSGMVERVICTDSHPRARSLARPGLEVRSLAPLVADALRGRP